MNIYIIYKLNLLSYIQDTSFTEENSLFGFKLNKNADFDKYLYYGTGLHAREWFSLSEGSEFGKNVIIFGTDMTSSVPIINKRKNTVILGTGPTDSLDDITLAAANEYSIIST